eukprot:3316849-Rhodomonas_salina.1
MCVCDVCVCDVCARAAGDGGGAGGPGADQEQAEVARAMLGACYARATEAVRASEREALCATE